MIINKGAIFSKHPKEIELVKLRLGYALNYYCNARIIWQNVHNMEVTDLTLRNSATFAASCCCSMEH